MKYFYHLILLPILLSITSSCEKGENIESKTRFTTLQIQSLNNGLGIQSLVYNGALINNSSEGYLIPYTGQDSITITVKYHGRKPSITKKLKINPSGTSTYIYYSNPVDSIATIGDHPLKDIKVPEGKLLVKFINNSPLLPKDKPIHLAFYDFRDWNAESEALYSEHPIDTIKNIGTTIPDTFSEFKDYRTQYFWKAKILNADFTPYQHQGKNVYYYMRFYSLNNPDIYIVEVNFDSYEEFDFNYWMELEDGSYAVTGFYFYMLRNRK
ncbi:hypothetical protein [Sphingobacterium lactis]|uniref:hypothetical protein n=1 Tax=Sphingobacterium lactis TaxID=797291 RepID=UPI003DA2611D